MKGYLLHAVNDLRYEEREYPECATGWCVVKVIAAGICSSDRLSAGIQREHFYRLEQPENLLDHEKQVLPIFRIYPGGNARDFANLLPGTVCRNNRKVV